VEKVAGIGGFFFRSEDPGSLAEWCANHLGVDPPGEVYEAYSWQQQAGSTVFSPFPSDSDYFAADHAWMINFRVDDMDSMITQLRQSGIEVELHDEFYPNGRFAHLADPEGNPIELWEPFHRDAGSVPDERLDLFFRLFERIGAALADGDWKPVDELFMEDAAIHLDLDDSPVDERWAFLAGLSKRQCRVRQRW